MTNATKNEIKNLIVKLNKEEYASGYSKHIAEIEKAIKQLKLDRK